MKRIALALLAVALVGGSIVTIVVEREAAYRIEPIAAAGRLGSALVLYHPSRDAHFSDDLSLAVARGLGEAGWRVDRETLTSETPGQPREYQLVIVVSNTYFQMPDRPTLRWLARAKLDGIPTIGMIGGLGATGRSERVLGEALRATGAQVLGTQSYWIMRPNDERRLKEPNRRVALDRAAAFAHKAAAVVADPANAIPQ